MDIKFFFGYKNVLPKPNRYEKGLGYGKNRKKGLIQ